VVIGDLPAPDAEDHDAHRDRERKLLLASDQVIVPEPGVKAMTTAIRGLVTSGHIAHVGTRSLR